MNWLIRTLVDIGWVRLGLSFRSIFGTQQILTALVNGSDLQLIKRRHELIEKSGFFSGEKGAVHQHAFIKALFAYDAHTKDAFSHAVSYSYSSSEGTVEPLRAFLNFIRRAFFQGPYREDNIQAFVEAVLTQHNGESNALSRTAWAKNPSPQQPELNPLTVVLNALAVTGCFLHEHAAENRQRFINGVFASNKEGKNALYNALRSRDFHENQCPNIKLLLDALANADCFSGPSAELNKQAFIRAVVVNGNYGGVLSEAAWGTNLLQQIFTALTDAGCFANESSKQFFIDSVCSSDVLARNPLFSAVCSGSAIKQIYDHLKQAGCLTSIENKQKLINAIFAQNKEGESPFFLASDNKEVTATVLNILTEAGCFDGPAGSPNQQAFINAVFATNKYGMGCLFEANDKQILNQLMKIKYFEGPFAEQNKQAFINVVFAPTKRIWDGKSAFSRNSPYPSFPLFLEHLAAAGCFSVSSRSKNKETFISAVFAKDKHGATPFSKTSAATYYADGFIPLLKELAESGCFDKKAYKKQFCQAVRADENAALSSAAGDLKTYLALHKSLLLAGFSVQNIKELLNAPRTQRYGFTPLMMALRDKKDLLAARLIADGAEELTAQQKQLVEQYINRSQNNRSQNAFNKVESFDIAAIKEELTQPEESVRFKKPKLERRVSLSDLSFFAEKQSDASSKCAADDTALIKSAVAPR